MGYLQPEKADGHHDTSGLILGELMALLGLKVVEKENYDVEKII